MEIIKTYNTRRNTRGSNANATSNPSASATSSPAAGTTSTPPPSTNVSSTAANTPTPTTTTSSSAGPATNTTTSTPTAAAVIPTITTRRSTGRAAALAAAANANVNSTSSSSSTSSPSSSTEDTTTKGQSQSQIQSTGGDDHNANSTTVPTSSSSSLSQTPQPPQPIISTRASSRTRRGSASSNPSTAATMTIHQPVTRRRSERGAAQAQQQQQQATAATSASSGSQQGAEPEAAQKKENRDNNANEDDNQRSNNKNIAESSSNSGSAGSDMTTNGSASATSLESSSSTSMQTRFKENGNNNETKISSSGSDSASVLETSRAVTEGEAGATAPSVTTTATTACQALDLIEIEKSLIAKSGELLKVKGKRGKTSKSSAEKSEDKQEEVGQQSHVKQEEDSLPPIVFLDGATSLPLGGLSNSAGDSGSVSTGVATASASSVSASSEDSNSVQSFDEESSPKPIATTTYKLTLGDDGTIYFNPTTPDAPVIEEGETFTVNLPTHKIKSPTNPLPGIPPARGRARKTKPQAVTYGGDSTVGFLDPTIGSQVTMEVGHHHQLQPAGTIKAQRQGSGTGPTAVITLETPPGGDVTSTSAIVSLEVPSGSIDPNYFESQLDPQSIAVLENVLQSDQGREILTEALGMGVVSVPDSAGPGWGDSSFTQGKDDGMVSSSAVTPSDSPSSSTVSSPKKDSLLRGPGRPPGRPGSASSGSGRGSRGGSAPSTPGAPRKLSESDASIRRSQRQQDRIERQEAERILAENQQMLQREKEQMLQKEKEQMQALQAASITGSVPGTPTPAPQQPQQPLQPVHVGIVSSTQAPPTPPVSSIPTTPTSANIDSTPRNEQGGGSGRRPVRQRKLPAHLADPNYLSLEDLSVKEASRRSSTATQHEMSEDGSAAPSPIAAVAKSISEKSEDDHEEVKEASGEDPAGTEEDEDYTDDDPNRLWCICRKPHNGRFMICCDQCEDWFHGKCVGVTKAQGKAMELKNQKWYCPNCKKLKAAEIKEVKIAQKQQQRQDKAATVAGRQRKSVGSVSESSVENNQKPQQHQIQKSQSQLSQQSQELQKTPKSTVSAKSTKLTPAAAAQKAEAEAAASAAASAQMPSVIAAAAAKNRSRRRSERGEDKEPLTSGMSCMVCKKPARMGSVYCSDLCVQKFSESVGSGKATSPKEKEKISHLPATSPTTTVATTTSSPVPSATTPTAQKTTATTPTNAQATTKPKRQNSVPESIFEFHVVTPGASVSTAVVPAKAKPQQKELTASALYKKQQQEKAEKEKGGQSQSPSAPTSPNTSAGRKTPTPGTPHQSPLPTVQGISPNSVNAIVNSSPNVVVKKVDDVSKGMTSAMTMILINTNVNASASASDLAQEQDLPVSCPEKQERQRTSSISESQKSNRSTSSSSSNKSSSKESSTKEKLERRDSQKESSRSSDGPTSEKLMLDNWRKSIKEILKKRVANDMSSTDKKKMEAMGNTPETLGVKIVDELVSCYGGINSIKCKTKYRSLYFNLKDEKNSIFLEILKGNIKPYDLVRMTPDQMAPHELAQWRKQEEEKELEAIKRSELDKLAEAKKQELLDKGVDNALEVAEESKPLDISDIIIDPEAEQKQKDKSQSKDSKDKERSHHHHRDRHHRDRDKDKERETRSRDKDRERDKDKDKDRDRDRDHKTRDKDKDRHRHSEKDRDKEKEKDKKSEKESRHSSSRHKSSHHDKEKEKSKDKEREKEKDEKRRSERHRDKDKEKDSSLSASSKVKHDSKDKDKESRSEKDKERSSRQSRSRKDSEKEKDRHRDRDKDKVKTSNESSKSPKDEKQEKIIELKDSDKKEQQKEKDAPQKDEKISVGVSEIPSYAAGFDPPSTSAKSATAEEQQNKDKPAPTENISQPAPNVISETNAAKPSTLKEDVRHSSVDSEQELPSSTIKTPDFTDDSSLTSGGKKEQEKPPVFESWLEMPELGKFNASFYNVSHNDGTLSGKYFPMSPVPIIGRISPQTVWDYIDKMKKSKEIIVFRLAPASPEDAKVYMTYFTYLSSRERLGVMGGISYPLKDVYLIPLDKHHPVPRCLLPFRGPGLPQERTHCLLAVVTRHFPEFGIGLKRKASAEGSEAAKKKLKKAPSLPGARVLRSSSNKDKDKVPSPPIDQQAVPSPASTSGKGDDNEPYTPWEDDEELAKSENTTTLTPVTTPADLSSELNLNLNDEMSITMRIKEIEDKIAKEKQDITSILTSKTISGIPGLDGDFPDDDLKNVDDSHSFLRTAAMTRPQTTPFAPDVALMQAPTKPLPTVLSSLDPRSTRSSIFKNQQQQQQSSPPPVLPPHIQSSPPPSLVKQPSIIPGLEPVVVPVPEDSCTPPHLEPEVVELKEDSEEAYSPSAITFSDEDDTKDRGNIDKDAPPPSKISKQDVEFKSGAILACGDIDERVLTLPPVPPVLPLPIISQPPPATSTTVATTICGDIDERISVVPPKIEDHPPVITLDSSVDTAPTQHPPPLINLDEKQAEEIKNILSTINASVPQPIPSLAEQEGEKGNDETVELLDDSEPPPPGETAPLLPPLRPTSPPPLTKNKVFEDSPFEKTTLKLGGTSSPGKLKININLSTKILPAVEPEKDSKPTSIPRTPESQPPLFKDIDERIVPSPVKESTLAMPVSEGIVLPPVDFMSIPPPGLLGTPPPNLGSVPLHLPPPSLQPPPGQVPAPTTTCVINLNVPPPPFIAGLAPPGFPTPPLALPPPQQHQPPVMPRTPPSGQGFIPKHQITSTSSPASSTSRSSYTSSPGKLQSTDRGDQDMVEREGRGFTRRNNFGRDRSGDRRTRNDRDDNRKRRGNRSRSRGRSSRSRSRSRSRDRKRRRRYSRSRSRSRSPLRRSSRRNRSRSRSRSPVL